MPGVSALGMGSLVHAMCTFNADAAAAAFLNQRGFAAAFVRNGVGDYSLALTEGIAQNNAVIIAQSNGGGNFYCDAAWVDATHVRVRGFTAADAANDVDFSLVILDTGAN